MNARQCIVRVIKHRDQKLTPVIGIDAHEESKRDDEEKSESAYLCVCACVCASVCGRMCMCVCMCACVCMCMFWSVF